MSTNMFNTNPSEYDGRIIEENTILKNHLRWCLKMLELIPFENSHSGPCSPPATPCDGSCMDKYYFYEQLREIQNLIN